MASTVFRSLRVGSINDRLVTIAEVLPLTIRENQIPIHARSLGHPVYHVNGILQYRKWYDFHSGIVAFEDEYSKLLDADSLSVKRDSHLRHYVIPPISDSTVRGCEDLFPNDIPLSATRS